MRATTNRGGWFLLCAAAGLLALVSCGDNPAGPTGLLDLDQLADDNLVLDGPIAHINASATIAIAPATIKFSAAGSVSPFGDIVAYEWDFGAGDTVAAGETYHTFVDPGLHTVHLTVYDQIGESGSAAAQVAVLPEVEIACVPAGASGPAPLRLEASVVNIDGTSSLPGDVEFRWDFGDGTVGEGPNVVHVYERPGRYTLVLVLALGALTLQGDQLVVTVDGPFAAENQPPVADAGADQVVVDEDGDGAEFVLLDGSGSYDPDGKIVWHRWALTEGSQVLAVGQEPKCEVPLAVGQHDITLTVTDDRGAQSSDSLRVTVVARAALAVLAVTPADDFASEGEVGGAFSPEQMVYTLTNAGQEELDWTATKTQSWVSLSSAGGTLAPGASTTVTVSINAAADALAAGSYSDTVTFTNTTTHSGDTTRGVSLTVNPPAGVLAVTPGTNLVSSGTVGGPFTPSSQAYTLQNTGGQSLNWTAAKTQSWVSLSSAGGTLAAGASTTVTVSINAAADALAAGSYSDTVTFTNTTTHSGDTTRGVSLTVNPPAGVLAVTPGTNLVSSGTVGGPFTPSSQAYTLQNTGGQSLNWTAAKTQSWVSLSSAGGTLAAGASTTVTVSINAAADALAAGSYSDTVTFTNTTTHSGDTTRGVSLTVNPPAGVLAVTPGTNLVSSGTVGGPFTPSSQAYTLQNTGGQSLNWTAAKTQSWVSLSSAGGTLAAGASTTVTVSINAAADALAAGSYSDTVTFTNTTTHSGDTTRGVSLTVNPPAGVLAVTPGTNLVSSGTVGGPFTPSSQAYTLQNTGGQSLNWTAAKTQSWVSLSSAGGTLAAGASTTVTVSINAAADALAAGSYSDTVTFTNTTTHSGDTTRGVSLTVNPPAGVLAVTPGTNLVSSGTVGGPFTPSSQAYTLQNTGGQSLNWTAAKTQSWVSLSSAGGTLAAGASTTVTVSINAAADALAAGSYSDTVTFTNTTTHSGDTTRGVSLTVNPPAGVLAVTPGTNLVSSGTVGGPFTPSSQAYTLQNTGGQSLNWTAAKTQSWVSLSSAGGTLAAGASTTVTVSINAAADALAAGSYSDTVTFTNTTTHSGDTTRGVSLDVTEFDAMPMTTASRTSGVAPLGVFFDVIDTADPAWTSSVVQPRGFADHPVSITGVRLTRVEYGMPLGNGTLSYDVAGATLRWQAAGEAYGDAVDVSAGGSFALPSGGSRNLHVWVNPVELPTVDDVDTITIVDGGLNADWASFHYEWDFGNPAPVGTSPTDPLWYWEHGAKKSDGSWFEKNRAFGWNAAHVYENPGTYVVTLLVIDDVDGEHSYSQQIDVEDPEVVFNPPHGQTYYFAASGDDTTGDGSIENPFQSWDKARTLAGPNTRLLFRRGDAFDVTSALAPSIAPPFLLGAYGNGPRPIFHLAPNTPLVSGSNLTDARFLDFRVEGTDAPHGANAFNSCGRNMLLLRVDITKVNDAVRVRVLDPSDVIIQDCNIYGNECYAQFISLHTGRTARLGCRFSDHGEWQVRVYGHKAVTSHCLFRKQSTIKGHLRLVAAHHFTNMFNRFTENDSGQIFSLESDAGSDPPQVRHAAVVGNVFDYTGGGGGTAVGIHGARCVVIANNRILGAPSPGSGAALCSASNGTAHTRDAYTVRVLSNSVGWTPTDRIRHISISTDNFRWVYGWYAANNILAAPASDSSSTRAIHIVAAPASPALLVSDYNHWYAPEAPTLFSDITGAHSLIEWQSLGFDAHSPTDDPMLLSIETGDLRLSGNSPAIGAGDTSYATWCRIDADGKHRGPAPSIGAFEGN